MAAVGKALGEAQTIAIDGKAMRHALPVMVTAWGCQLRMTLAACAAAGGNEAAAALELLTCLDLQGATVTADALHCRCEVCPAWALDWR